MKPNDGRARRGAAARWLIAASCWAALPGCALLSPAQVETATKAVLGPGAVDVPHRRHCAMALLVFPPQARAIYETTQMAYASRAGEISYFARHEWAETPSQMLLPLLLEALRGTGCFATVTAPPYAYRYTYALRTEVVELLQDFTAQPAMLRLSLRVQLADDVSGRVIADREITLREPMSQRTPEAGVRAANAATAKALTAIASFVVSATSASRSRP